MTDVVGNPEEERHADFYHEPWAQEAVCRYFYGKVGRPWNIMESSELLIIWKKSQALKVLQFDSLASGRFEWNFKESHFEANFIDWRLEYLLWNSP